MFCLEIPALVSMDTAGNCPKVCLKTSSNFVVTNIVMHEQWSLAWRLSFMELAHHPLHL